MRFWDDWSEASIMPTVPVNWTAIPVTNGEWGVAVGMQSNNWSTYARWAASKPARIG